MSKRHLKTAMLWFMGACITFYLIGPSESFHKCIGERKNTQPFQALHEGDRILVKFILRIQLNMVCGFVSSDANAGAITGLAGVVVAVFTGTLWWVTWSMVSIANQQRSDMLRSVAASEKSAIAASQSANLAERALIEIERALIVGLKVETVGLQRNQNVIGYRLIFIFINSGRTVAKSIASCANFTLFDRDTIPSGFTYPDRIPSLRGHGVLGPSVVMPVPVDVAIQDIVDIHNTRKTGLLYGWVEYNDIFSATTRRRTEFCVKVEVTGDPYFVTDQLGGPSIFDFATYGPYNATDKQCFHEPGKVPIATPGELSVPTQPPPDSSSLG